MPGRTSDVSVSTFKPLSLQEIMMVPIAKQKMEDEVLAANDAEQELTTKVSAYDKEAANNILKGLQGRASSIADEVLSKGVTRNDINKMKKLRSDTNKEYSSGNIGRLQGNYAAQSEYLKALTTQSGRQGGYSAKEAQAFAQKNIRDFGSSINEDGSFKSFQGREMSKHYDEDKFIKEAIDGVAEKVDEGAYTLTKIGGLDALHDAFQKGTVEQKDFNTIMLAIKTKAQTNNSFKSHLNQMAEIYGEKENPLDFGNFDTNEQPVLDRSGNPVLDKKTGKPLTRSVTSFTPGKGRFGIKAAGLGAVASYRNIDIDTKILKNEVRAKMWNDNYDKEKIVKMYGIHKGEFNHVSSGSLDEIYQMNEEFENSLTSYKTQLDTIGAEIKEIGDPKNEEEQQRLVNLVSEQKNMLKHYSQAKVDYDNTKSYIDQLKSNSFKNLNKSDKSTININKIVSNNNGDPVEAVINELGVTYDDVHNNLYLSGKNQLEKVSEYNQKYDLLKKQGKHKEADKYFDMANLAQEEYDKALRISAYSLLGKKYGILSGSDQQGSQFGIDFENGVYDKKLKSNRDNFIQEKLSLNKKAVPYTKVSMSEASKYSSKKFADFNEMIEDNINLDTSILAGSRDKSKTIKQFMETTEFKDALGEAPKGYSFQRSYTINGYDDKGRYFDEIVIRNNEIPTNQITIQVVADNNSRMMAGQLFQDLKESNDGDQVLKGEQGEANLMFMPAIKKSMLRDNEKGSMQISLPNGAETNDVTFEKVVKISQDGTDRSYYKVYLLGEAVSYNNNTDLRGEDEIALGLMQSTKELMEAINQNKRK